MSLGKASHLSVFVVLARFEKKHSWETEVGLREEGESER